MDTSQTINTQTLSTVIQSHVTQAKTPEARRLVLDLATDIGNKLQNTFGVGRFNQSQWLEACGITPEWREQVQAAA